ncbi:MAG TPA: lipoyl(octanoyl) transferase LipB [Bacteroidales bacterium]|nr:lipoyl(octanoyl) transferase LipB [Bacteroidales bacterium]
MTKEVDFHHLGIIDYKEAWDKQESYHKEIVERKLGGGLDSNYGGHLILCEHPHVYTLGKSGAENNLLINDNFLQKIGATYYKINRGGDITYHGPGQLVGYPIIDLEQFGLHVKEYVSKLEEAIIKVLGEYGISASRLDGATGVWLDASVPGKARKICAIGVRVSRYVTMHGFALNVNTDLTYFNHINPCGFTDKGVTSMEKELGRELPVAKVENSMKAALASVFDFSIRQ